MKISIIHPSRTRPTMSLETAKKWVFSMRTTCEYFFGIDSDDPTKEEYITNTNYLISLFPNHQIKCFVNDSKSSVEAINIVAKNTTNELLIVVSDDFDCFDGWDEWLLEKLVGKSDFIVKTKDNIQSRLITLPILDRKYYERFGYIYYPEYKHLFSDTEMTEVAHILGKVIDLQDDNHVFFHKHPWAGYFKDELYHKNDGTWGEGEKLFNERKLHNFYI